MTARRSDAFDTACKPRQIENAGLTNGSFRGQREQRVLTPRPIIDALERLWPQGIALDPAGAPGSLVRAEQWACPDEGCGADFRDGLSIQWSRRTYVNPPFSTLRPWMEHASGFEGVAMLAPVRPNRSWWLDAVQAARAICWLKPVKFLGESQVIPLPICMIYWDYAESEDIDRFCFAFASIGRCCLIKGSRRPNVQMTFVFGG